MWHWLEEATLVCPNNQQTQRVHVVAELQGRPSSVCSTPGLTPPRWRETKACGRWKRSALIVASTCKHRLPYTIGLPKQEKQKSTAWGAPVLPLQRTCGTEATEGMPA